MRWIANVATCWLVTAVVVAETAHAPETQALIVALAALLTSRLLVRNGAVNRAFIVGAAWLAFSVAAEIAMTIALRHSWFALLGSPAEGWRRDVVMMTWLGAPALFVRWPITTRDDLTGGETRCA